MTLYCIYGIVIAGVKTGRKFNVRIRSDYLKILEDQRKEITETDEYLTSEYSRTKDIQLAQKLFIKHYKLSLWVIEQITRGRWYSDDCLQAAALGVLHALQKFDTDKEVKFTTYAVFWIKKYVYQQAASETLPLGGIVIPQAKKELLYRFLSLSMMGLTDTEIQEKLKLNTAGMNELQDRMILARVYSYEDLLLSAETEGSQLNIALMREPSAEDIYIDKETEEEQHTLIETLLESLTELEREVIEYSFGLNGKPVVKGVALTRLLKEQGVYPLGTRSDAVKLARIRQKAIIKLKRAQRGLEKW